MNSFKGDLDGVKIEIGDNFRGKEELKEVQASLKTTEGL